jgi:2-keto-4-pentenoate hydratase
MADDRVNRAAAWLHETRSARRKLMPLPKELRPADLREAYAVQNELLSLYKNGGRGDFGGAKIAITTKVMQELMKIDQPCGGTIFASMIHRSPARLKRADFGNIAVECEIAVRLGADLDKGGYTRASVGEAVEACMAAIELIDDGNAEYGAFDALDLVADNAWNAGLVIGEPVTNWRRIDVAAASGTMTIGSRFEGRGKGADVMGHPFEALAWLANTYAAQGRPLRRGMVVTTGSVVSTQWPQPGEEVVVRIEGLGEARARFD